jgi:ABC-type glutathione transport system ATPase component
LTKRNNKKLKVDFMSQSQLLLQLQQVSYTYPRGWLDSLLKTPDAEFSIKDVSLSIEQGRNIGLIGKSGHGKTTLGKIIAYLVPKLDSGQIFFAGSSRNLYDYSYFDKEVLLYRKQVHLMFQNPDASLHPGMKLRTIVAEAIEARINKPTDKREINVLVDEYLGMVGLTHKAKDYPNRLSGGEKRRASIIRALALKPKLLIADEPFVELDISLRNYMVDLLLKKQKEDGITYLFILHDHNLAEYLCDTIVRLDNGRLTLL